MPIFLLLGLLCLSLTAQAQYDAGGQNTHGANIDPGKLDPATKARIRAEGSVGGIQDAAKAEPPKENSASAGASKADKQTPRDNKDSRPGSRELEERR